LAARVGLDRETVIQTAVELADEDGLERLTLASLAKRLGVRSQSLYAHVDGLPGLRRDLQIAHHRMLADRMRAASAGSGRKALLALARAWAGFYDEHPGLLILTESMAEDLAEDDPELWRWIIEGSHPLRGVLRTFGLDEEGVVHWERIVWTSIHGFVSIRQAGMLRRTYDPDVTYEMMFNAFADALETQGAMPKSRRPQSAGVARKPPVASRSAGRAEVPSSRALPAGERSVKRAKGKRLRTTFEPKH